MTALDNLSTECYGILSHPFRKAFGVTAISNRPNAKLLAIGGPDQAGFNANSQLEARVLGGFTRKR